MAVKITLAANKTGTIYFPLMYGTLNLLSAFIVRLSNTNMPPQTNTNANNVPILVKASTTSRFKNNAGIATTKPVSMVENEGVLNFG